MDRLLSTIPPLHAGTVDPTGWLHSDWNPEISTFVGVGAVVALYVVWTGSKNRTSKGKEIHPVGRGQRWAFGGSCAALLIALNPPLEDWAEHYLLVMHMVQHLILIFVVAPLLVLGTPGWLLRKLVGRRSLLGAGFALTRPAAAILLSNLVMVAWHIPAMYDAALTSLPIHVVQHLTFLVTAMLAWWPVMGRMEEWPALSPLSACVYLFLVGIPSGIVGAFITFAAPGLYTVYPDAVRIWGLDLETDQLLAGLLMWVVTPLFYLLALTIVFFRWSAREDAAEQRGRRGGRHTPAPRPAQS